MKKVIKTKRGMLRAPNVEHWFLSKAVGETHLDALTVTFPMCLAINRHFIIKREVKNQRK